MYPKFIVPLALQFLTVSQGELEVHYGTDISWPMHSYNVSTNYPWLQHNIQNNVATPLEYQHMPIQPLGDRQSIYNEFMKGCFDMYGAEDCIISENGRTVHNLHRIKYMVNFTELGFKKVKAPRDAFDELVKFYDKYVQMKELEYNDIGETTNNHWVSPSYMINLENEDFVGGDELKLKLWGSIEDEMSEWVNLELKTSVIYGIRIYTEGAILNSHVDDLPRICSAIINVAQDVDEPWPLEVIGHDGKAYNVTMEPGDMILYESHSLIHGRPFALKGRYYANIFIHFEPKEERKGRPYYITQDVPEIVYMKWFEDEDDSADEVRHAAATGDLQTLKDILADDESLLFDVDENGWSPLHEAVRAGHINIIEFLLANGADVNEVTGGGDSVFDLLTEYNGSNSEILRILQSYSDEHDEI